ncbi:hypothetical protein EPN52_12595 [bacterium]|nr:MAG: hypothetical protein EPN52_12595 [bacterium]
MPPHAVMDAADSDERKRLEEHLAKIREVLDNSLETCGDLHEQAEALERLAEIEAFVKRALGEHSEG